MISVRRMFGQLLPTKAWLIQNHRRRIGVWPNIRQPRTFNEKLLWLKLNYNNQLLPRLVHKFDVREYVAGRVGPNVLVDVFAHFESLQEFGRAHLPPRYIAKACHASGWNRIVTESSPATRPELEARFSQWLAADYGRNTREWPYTQSRRSIIVERLLDGPGGGAPWDYKFFCFNGKPKLIQVDIDRFDSHKRVIMTTDWRPVPVKYLYSAPDDMPSCPSNLDRMLDVAEALAKGLPFCRIDLYDVHGKCYFGEITLFPENASGQIEPSYYDALWGDWLAL